MTPEQVMKEIEETAPGLGLPIIGPKRGAILDEVVSKHKPSAILEVGTLVGYSAIRMARHLKPGQKVTCVELREDMARTARSNAAKAGLSDRIEVIVGDARRVLPTLTGKFDMIFLDAVKGDYLAYLKDTEHLLTRGGVVVADNVKSHWSEVAGYLEYVRRSGRYTSSYRESESNYGTDAGDAAEVSIKT